MKKSKRIIGKQLTYEIKLPGAIIITGPGTVPTSGASVSQTSIKEMVTKLRIASKKGVFDSKEDTSLYGSFRQSER